MSVKILSSRPSRAIVTQKGATSRTAHINPLSQAEIKRTDPPAPRSGTEQSDPMMAAWKVEGLELTGYGASSGDRMIVELERIVRIIEQDISRNPSRQNQLSLNEGRKFLQEYSRRLRMTLNAGAQNSAVI